MKKRGPGETRHEGEKTTINATLEKSQIFDLAWLQSYWGLSIYETTEKMILDALKNIPKILEYKDDHYISLSKKGPKEGRVLKSFSLDGGVYNMAYLVQRKLFVQQHSDLLRLLIQYYAHKLRDVEKKEIT